MQWWSLYGLKVIVCVINSSRRDGEGEKYSENKTGTSERPKWAEGPHSDRDCQEASLEGLVATDRVWLVSVDVTLRGDVVVYPGAMVEVLGCPLQNNVLCKWVWAVASNEH